MLDAHRGDSSLSKSMARLAPGQIAEILSFSDDLSESFLTRLRELGFREGEVVRCVRHLPLGAPPVFEICGTNYSVDFDVASQIQTRVVTGSTQNK